MKNLGKITGTILTAAIGGVIAIYGYSKFNKVEIINSVNSPNLGVKNVTYTSSLPSAEMNFVAAAEQSVNAVVHIKTKSVVQNQWSDPWQDFFFGTPNLGRPQVQISSGSGVIISQDGYIATNNHVVDKAEELEVVLNNKKSYSAKVIGTDPSTDLALLKIEEAALPYLSYGNSDNLQVGEWVLAVGNPFNLTSTVTAGIVSAKGRNVGIIGNGDVTRSVVPIESFIQTDAAVNPGNSGGALVNAKGELLGINTAIASNTGAYTGYSFAIPVNIVKKVMSDLLEFGEVQRAFIGVSIREIDNKLAEEKELKSLNGVFVTGTTEGGAAQEAGVEEGDIITKVGDAEVNSPSELTEQVGRYRPGDKVNIEVIRENKSKILAMVLKNRNGNVSVVKKSASQANNLLGASFENLNSEELRELKIAHGVRVNGLASGKLKGAGIKEGFVITSIDKKPVKEISDIEKAIGDKKGGVLIEGVYPNGLRAYYGFGL